MRGKVLATLVTVLGIVFLIYSAYPHESKPPKFQVQNQVWPSCHWDGSQDKNDWEVEFYVIDWKQNKTVWKKWVATGISEKAAEQLCDAYIGVIDPNKPEGK